MNLSKIMTEAHRKARIVAGGTITYRKALAHGLRQAWGFYKGVAEIEARMIAEAVAEGPVVTALRTQVMTIQTQDRMTPADFQAVRDLWRQIDELAA